MNEILEDQIVLYVDLLGFSESSLAIDAQTQFKVLQLLTGIASLKSEFLSSIEQNDNGTTHRIHPSVSTFSDHIVASYSISRIEAKDEKSKAFAIMFHLSRLVPAIAIAALGLGFLIRGGVTFGKLHHSGGVVFGSALVEAVRLESRIAIYPRIVACEQAAQFFDPYRSVLLMRDFDGLACVNYYRDCIWRGAMPGEDFSEKIQEWIVFASDLLNKNLQELKQPRFIGQRAKWVYFADKWKQALSQLGPEFSKHVEKVQS